MKTKLTVGIFACLCFCVAAFAQPQNPGAAKVQSDADKKKTGQSQDILADYIQVVANNISSTNKGVQLKLNWFALNGMDSVKKYNDAYFYKSRWQRNGQIMLGTGLDNSNKFNAISGGLTYNVLNKRDTVMQNYHNVYASSFKAIESIKNAVETQHLRELQDLVNTKVDKIVDEALKKAENVTDLQDVLTQTFKNYRPESQDTSLIKAAQREINSQISAGQENKSAFKMEQPLVQQIAKKMLYDALNQYETSKGKQLPEYDSYITEVYFNGVLDEINKAIKVDATLQQTTKASDITDLFAKLNEKYEQAIAYVARQPLITGSYTGTYGTGTVLNSHVLAGQLLWGLAKLGSEKSTQFTATISDTLTSKDQTGVIRSLDRNLITIQAGLNFSLAKIKKASVMELNISLENDFITEGAIKNQWNIFMFNSYFRARLPGTPWLKFNIKYAPQNHNILGFLNFTYNIDKS